MRSYKDDDLTLYEKDIKKLCLKIRVADTIEQAIEILLISMHDSDKKFKI